MKISFPSFAIRCTAVHIRDLLRVHGFSDQAGTKRARLAMSYLASALSFSTLLVVRSTIRCASKMSRTLSCFMICEAHLEKFGSVFSSSLSEAGNNLSLLIVYHRMINGAQLTCTKHEKQEWWEEQNVLTSTRVIFSLPPKKGLALSSSGSISRRTTSTKSLTLACFSARLSSFKMGNWRGATLES